MRLVKSTSKDRTSRAAVDRRAARGRSGLGRRRCVTETDRAAVIGGGLGGLAAACTLAARLPGRCSRRTPGSAARRRCSEERLPLRHGADHPHPALGPARASSPRPAGDLDDDLDLVRLDPQWRSFFADGSDARPAGRRRPDDAPLDAFARGTGRRLPAFPRTLRATAPRLRAHFFWRSIGGLGDMFDLQDAALPATLLGRCAGHAAGPHGGRNGPRRTCADARVAQMLDHFTQYVGSLPDRVAGGAVRHRPHADQRGRLVSARRHGRGAAALARLADRAGRRAADRNWQSAASCSTDGRRRPGVETERGEEHCRWPRSCRTPTPCGRTASCWRGPRRPRGSNAAAATSRPARASCSTSGWTGATTHLLHHNFVFSRDPEEEFDSIYRRGEPAPDPTCYVCAPGRTEPGRRPAGRRGAVRPRPHAVPAAAPRLEALFPRYRRRILDKLRDHRRTAGPRGAHSLRARPDARRHPRSLRRPQRRDLRAGQPRPLVRGVQAGEPQPGRQRAVPRGRRGPPRPGDADGADVRLDRRRRARSRRRGKPAINIPQIPGPASVDCGTGTNRFTAESGSAERVVTREVVSDVVTRRSPRLVGYFRRHVKRFHLARSFHALRMSKHNGLELAV